MDADNPETQPDHPTSDDLLFVALYLDVMIGSSILRYSAGKDQSET